MSLTWETTSESEKVGGEIGGGQGEKDSACLFQRWGSRDRNRSCTDERRCPVGNRIVVVEREEKSGFAGGNIGGKKVNTKPTETWTRTTKNSRCKGSWGPTSQ